jgi:hypothetical protein
MVKEYLEYYFKIIDLPLPDNFDKVDVQYKEFIERYMTNWKVDKDYFDFFLKRKQFGKGNFVIQKLKPKILKGANIENILQKLR